MTKGLSTAIFLLGGVVALFSHGMTTFAGVSNAAPQPTRAEKETVVDVVDWDFTASRREVARHQRVEQRTLTRLEKCLRVKMRHHQRLERQTRSISNFDFQQASDDCIAAIVSIRHR
jgi:hypothetical protein